MRKGSLICLSNIALSSRLKARRENLKLELAIKKAALLKNKQECISLWTPLAYRCMCEFIELTV
jgi:hypothetical protein